MASLQIFVVFIECDYKFYNVLCDWQRKRHQIADLLHKMITLLSIDYIMMVQRYE